MDYSHLGQRIKEERLKMKLTQAQLAEDINISNSYMGYIERGEKSLSLETLINFANRFHVSVDYLLQDSLSLDDDQFIDQFKYLINNKTQTEKQMAVDVIKTMYSYLTK
jgi:transcriptional regulator with XRE-family HTH domain